MGSPDKPAPAIIWFRNDQRLRDNPALHAAAQDGAPLLCIYIHEDERDGLRQTTGAALWWLHGSLADLDAALKRHGGALYVLSGRSGEIIPALVEATGARAVYWNRRYDEAGRDIDAGIKVALKERGVGAESFGAALLHEPWTIRNQSGQPFRVFTPYWREAMRREQPSSPLPAPRSLHFTDLPAALARRYAYGPGLDPDPQQPDWAKDMRAFWQRGAEAAREALENFLETGLKGYAHGRDRPDRPATSRLSPFLRAGNISVRQVWHALAAAQHSNTTQASDSDFEKFRAELGWREFCYQLLFHNPPLHRDNLQRQFDAMEWRTDDDALEAWRRGRTGYPIVDAAMRQLWTTGWMHNRARMIAASFLVKDLLIDWRAGEAWFWDTLVDADIANNPAGWQWVAGTGADAAPYFRVLNPVLQGEKFDPAGAYVRQWVPELSGLPDELIHRPWSADAKQLAAAGVRLGEDYPRPIVEHDATRRRALAAWRAMRGSHGGDHDEG